MEKKLLIIAIFVLLLNNVSALDFEVDQGTLWKGETLSIHGDAASDVTITATFENKTIFSKNVSLTNGEFFFTRKITFLDPKGEWQIEISDNDSAETKNIKVNPSRESEFLLIRFLSPPPISFTRTDVANIAVKITDSGEKVKNASVFFWDAEGKKVGLNNNGDGTYYLNYRIPTDAKLRKYKLIVVALAENEDFEKIGGENSIELFIETSPILIELIKPKSDTYIVGDPLEFEIKATFADGSPVENEKPSGVVNLEIINFQEKGEGIYAATFTPREIKEEVLNISINFFDQYENSGEKKFSLKPQDFMAWAIKENAILFAFPLILLVYIFLLTFNELKYFYQLNSARNKKNKLTQIKKKLHENFYKKSIITEKTFSTRNFQINTELSQVDDELTKLKNKAK